jgi:hypothetical protein
MANGDTSRSISIWLRLGLRRKETREADLVEKEACSAGFSV